MPTQTCTGCSKTKELSEFPLHGKTYVGPKTHRSKCFECKRAMDRVYAKKNVKVRSARSTAWYAERRKTITFDEIPHGAPGSRALWGCKCRPCVVANLAGMARLKQLVKTSVEDLHIAIGYRQAIDNDPCFYCGKLKDKMETDHIVPLRKGGLEVWHNLRRSCKDCNLSKNSRSEHTFMSIYLASNELPNDLARNRFYNKLLATFPDRVIPFVMTDLSKILNKKAALVQTYVRQLRNAGYITRKPDDRGHKETSN